MIITTISKILILLSCILFSESFGILHNQIHHSHSPLHRQHHDTRRRQTSPWLIFQQSGSHINGRRIKVIVISTKIASSSSTASTEQQQQQQQQHLNSIAATGISTSPAEEESSSSSSSFARITISTPRNTPTKRQKVAVIGSGAVGSYYGARLFEAGHDVQFYMRSPHYEACRQDGLRVTSVHGKVEIAAQDLHVVNNTCDMDPADWIIVSLKSSSLDAIPSLITSSRLLKADNSTRILVIMNGLIEDDLIQMMKHATGQSTDENNKNEPLHCCRALYGGMALICCNRLQPGHVNHSYAGLLSAGVACTSTQQRNDDNDSDDEDRLAFENLWSSSIANQDVAWESCLLRGRWKKMLWNLPFNGISVAMGGITVDQIVQDVNLRQLAMYIMDETIAAANAEMLQRYKDKSGGYYDPLTQQDKEQMMVFTDKMGVYKTSTMLDLVNRQTMEVEYMFCKPVERAERLGVPVPHLKTILTMIQAYQRLYNLF